MNNFLRILLVVNSLILVVQSVRIIAVYSAIYSLTSGPKRQLPLHVWLIAVSYLIYVLGTTYFTFTIHFQGQTFVRNYIYIVAGLIGQYSLWNVLSYERRKFTAARQSLESE